MELLLAVATMAFVAGILVALPQPGPLLMLLIGAIYRSVDYLAAPPLAHLSERGVRSETVSGSQHSEALAPEYITPGRRVA